MKKVFFSLLIILITGCLFYISQQPRIHFIQDEIHLSLYDEVKPYDYIEIASHIDIEELQINNQVNNQKLGKYEIQYQYHNKIFTLDVYIDDTIPPQFEINHIKVLRNATVDPKVLVKNIQDDSSTIVYFKEDYLFNEIKRYKVCVVVEDGYENKTEKYAYVMVVEKDEEPPTIKGLDVLRVSLNEKVDLKKDIEVVDDIDFNPQLTIDDHNLNIKKVGSYDVIYHVEDKYGNKATYTRIIQVVSPYDNKEAIADGKKTCYLTFDDGPSHNTEKVLEILDKYQIKATFFVTAENKEHAKYIKEAYQKGHTIGLHAYEHDYEHLYTASQNFLNDLKKSDEYVYQQTGVHTKVMRFPGGSSNMVSAKYNKGIMSVLTKKVIDQGYQYYDWNCMNGDAEGKKTVKEMIQTVKETVKDQEDIMLLMHDGIQQDNTVKALPDIIEYLKKQDYEFKAVDTTSPTFHHTVQN